MQKAKVSKARKKQSERDRLAHESPEDYGTPYRSSGDWSLGNRVDPVQMEEINSYAEDYNGDEDFYGDDEENQGGNAAYTGNQTRYLGRGEWVDERYGEKQYNHENDVDYQKQFRVHQRKPVTR